MKKEYESPKVVKVEFDYTESVAACGPSGASNGQGSTGGTGLGLHQENGVWFFNDQKVNNDPYGGWACRSTDHHDCYQF